MKATKVRIEAVAYLPGTDGSNPFPSCKESATKTIRTREVEASLALPAKQSAARQYCQTGLRAASLNAGRYR